MKVTVAVEVFAPSTVTDEGETEQLAIGGAPLQPKETAWLNPPAGLTVSALVADCPAVTVTKVGEADSEKSAPVPVKLTLCGLARASSATLTLALLAPLEVGANFTPKKHELPALRLLAPNEHAGAPLVGATSAN